MNKSVSCLHVIPGPCIPYVLSERPLGFAVGLAESALEHHLLIFAFLGILVDERAQE